MFAIIMGARYINAKNYLKELIKMSYSVTLVEKVKNKYLNLSALLILTALSSNSFAVPILDQSYQVSDGCCFGIGQASSGGAQTFTVGTSGLLSGFDVTLQGLETYDNNDPDTFWGYDGDVVFQIRDSSFSNILFSTTVAKNSISLATFNDYLFDVSAANILVDVGDVLAIVIEETGSGALSWNADFASAATYSGGTSWSFSDTYLLNNGYYEVNRDGAFRTYVEASNVPEPSIIALLGLGLAGLGLVRRRNHQS